MGKVIILDTTTKNPITLMGERAGICWGSDITDAKKNYKRGLDCMNSGHGRVLEFVNIEMVLTGYSARVMREWYTHIGCLPTRLQASTRYIDYGEFDYYVPDTINKSAAAYEKYVGAINHIKNALNDLEQMGIPREDAANLLPLGMSTMVVDKRNLRNVIDMSHQRKCNRAYKEFRQLFDDISCALIAYGSESGEWETIVKTQFKSKCDVVGYCNEKNGCGRMPLRQV